MPEESLLLRMRVEGGRLVAEDVGHADQALGKYERTASKAHDTTNRLSGAFSNLKSMAGMALGVAGIGGLAGLAGGLADAVKMSTAFSHEMLRIRTDAGATTRELNAMTRGVLDLAASGQSIGQGPMALAQGLYHLESLGIRGAKALQALKLASQESAISGADLEQTTSALGAAMYVGIKGTGDLQQTMGILNATVGAGNMRMQELVDALGTGILSSAKVAGLSIRDVGAALAVLSDGGQQASSGAAELATALHFLYAPSGKADTALQSIGLSSRKLAKDLRGPDGLFTALSDLHNHLSKLSGVGQEQVLSSILPGGRGRVLLSLYEQLGRLQGKYSQIDSTAGGFASSVAMQRKDPLTQFHEAQARIQADMIRMGNALTPILMPALAALLKAGSGILEWLTGALPPVFKVIIGGFRDVVDVTKDVIGWFGRHHDAAVALTAVVIGLGTAAGIVATRFLVVSAATKAWAAAQWLVNLALDANPIGLIITGLSALVVGLVYAYNHSKAFRDIISDIGNVASAVWDALKVGFASAILDIELKINTLIGFYNDTIGQVTGTIGLINTTGAAIMAGKLDAVGGGYTSAAANHASLLAHGTIGTRPTAPTYAVHTGPALHYSHPGHQPEGHAADSSPVIHTHVYIDGREAGLAIVHAGHQQAVLR